MLEEGRPRPRPSVSPVRMPLPMPTPPTAERLMESEFKVEATVGVVGVLVAPPMAPRVVVPPPVLVEPPVALPPPVVVTPPVVDVAGVTAGDMVVTAVGPVGDGSAVNVDGSESDRVLPSAEPLG